MTNRSANTLWLSDDEEIDLFEYYELLEEARQQVDDLYPRDGAQLRLLMRIPRKAWHETHDIMFELKRQFEEDD